MRCFSASSSVPDAQQAAHEIVVRLREGLDGEAPKLLVLGARASRDPEVLRAVLTEAFPGVALLGGSSCGGVMASGEAGHSEEVGVWAVSDARGAYGVGSLDLGDDPRAAGLEAAERALEQADRVAEAPALVWVTQSPGAEEAVLEGIAEAVGEDVPVLGGSSADDEVAGAWWQMSHAAVHTAGVSVAVLFPSTELGFAFQSGYAPTKRAGRVTAATGRRLETIDHEPAGDWYRGQAKLDLSGGEELNVLAATTLAPLGRPCGEVDGIATHLLVHPERLHADGSMSTFAHVEVGETLSVMEGTRRSLISRAGRVAQDALELAEIEPESAAGALIIYCGGCRLTVGEELDEVVDGLRAALPGVPFLGSFTFGEAGWLGEANRHGNLMISVLVWSKRRPE